MNNKQARNLGRFLVALSLTLIACFYLGTTLNLAPQVLLILIVSTMAMTFYAFILSITKRSLKHLGSVITGLLALCIVVLNPIDFIVEKLGSPILLRAYCEHQISGHSILLKESGDFTHKTPRLFTPDKKEHGTYTLRNDTLTLNFDKNPSILMPSCYTIEEKALRPLPDTSHYHHGFRIYENHLE